jgi:subtilase family serine protease
MTGSATPTRTATETQPPTQTLTSTVTASQTPTATTTANPTPTPTKHGKLKPDLQVIAVGDPPVTANRGSSFVIVDTVANLGQASAVPSITLYYLSDDVTNQRRDQPLSGQRLVPALPAPATSMGTASLTITSKTVPGTYFVLACADDRNDVQEENERNNCAVSAGTIQVLP